MGSRKRPFDLNNMVQNLDKKSKSLADARKTEANLAMMHGDGNSAAGAGRGPKLPTHDSESPDAAITNFLLSMRETIDARGVGAEVEVELRFGRISSTATTKRFEPSVYGNACVVLRDEDMRSNSAKFVPGVKATDYDRFMKKLQQISSQDSYAKHEEHSRVEMYPGSKRVVQEMDPNGRPSQPKYLQVKERLGSIDIFLPHCQYDCRVSISLEFPPSDPSSVVGSAPESERNRQRKSAIGQHVRIDLTEVSGDGSSGEPTYEVELELKPTAVKEWLNMAHEQTWVGANTNAGLLWNTLTRHFMPLASQAYKVNWDAMDPEHAIRNAYLSHFDHANKFPGTMPVGFARCNLPVVRARDREYFVSEKTDGVRYFLVVGPGVVVLVDRSSFAFVAPGLESLVSLLPEGTVLDGEYVFNYTLKRYVFMVFDIIAEGSLPSLSHVRKPFKERILAIQTLLSETYDDRSIFAIEDSKPMCRGSYERGMRGMPLGNVLPLFRKRWQSVRHIREVFKAISAHTDNGTGEIVRFYNDGKRHHKTDGVVFCPGTAPYVPFSHHDYFKWKWSDLITIDFFAWIENGQLKLNCSGPGKAIDLDQIVVVDPRDLKKIHATLQNAPNHQAVLEFAFNADVGYWQFKMARPDKDTPNYIRTVLSSLINMAEAISEEELQCRILVGDEWSSQMRAKRKQLFASLLHSGGTS